VRRRERREILPKGGRLPYEGYTGIGREMRVAILVLRRRARKKFNIEQRDILFQDGKGSALQHFTRREGVLTTRNN
jgi:nitric oxide reductase activation protein